VISEKTVHVLVLCWKEAIGVFESDLSCNSYLNQNFYMQVCHEAAMEYECTRKKALNIMCSVGRFSYELSKYFDKVL